MNNKIEATNKITGETRTIELLGPLGIWPLFNDSYWLAIVHHEGRAFRFEITPSSKKVEVTNKLSGLMNTKFGEMDSLFFEDGISKYFANCQQWEVLDEEGEVEFTGGTEDVVEYLHEHQVYGKIRLILA